MNLWSNPNGTSEIYTPFFRVSNSYNGKRALSFDIGFIRKHCANGVIFEKAAKSIKASHTRHDIQGIDLSDALRDFDGLKTRFEESLRLLKETKLLEQESFDIVLAALKLRSRKANSDGDCTEGESIIADLAALDLRHRAEIGDNAYATFNTISDFATRPPRARAVRADSVALQSRAGTWLRGFCEEVGRGGFSARAHIESLQGPSKNVPWSRSS